MHFDFEGAAPQTNHFFNSKTHIIRAIVVSDITDVLAHDLPLSAGLFAPISLNCPEGTVVNSRPPAPTASAHFDCGVERQHGCAAMRHDGDRGVRQGFARPAFVVRAGGAFLHGAAHLVISDPGRDAGRLG